MDRYEWACERKYGPAYLNPQTSSPFVSSSATSLATIRSSKRLIRKCHPPVLPLSPTRMRRYSPADCQNGTFSTLPTPSTMQPGPFHPKPPSWVEILYSFFSSTNFFLSCRPISPMQTVWRSMTLTTFTVLWCPRRHAMPCWPEDPERGPLWSLGQLSPEQVRMRKNG